jgi:two-component system cell cycle response regulator
MRVLIADDNLEATETLALMLRGWGYEPLIARDGNVALSVLRGPDAPPLAILDCIMPGMNGDAVCKEIRKDHGAPYTYIILISGRCGKQEMFDGLKDGADDYLTKPLDPDELCARLTTANRILRLQEQHLASQRLLREQASRDPLTGLWNRVSILEILDGELPRSQRDQRPVAIIMVDVDNLKPINDAHGHLAGDEVLRQTARRLLAGLRPYDTVGRYGGDEFLVVLTGCGEATALQLAERLRRFVEREPVVDEGKSISVTLSLGVAVWDGTMTAQQFLRHADGALYSAKVAGRNRATLAK